LDHVSKPLRHHQIDVAWKLRVGVKNFAIPMAAPMPAPVPELLIFAIPIATCLTCRSNYCKDDQ